MTFGPDGWAHVLDSLRRTWADSILPTEAVRAAKNIRVMSIAPLIGEAIARTSREESVSSLFY